MSVRKLAFGLALVALAGPSAAQENDLPEIAVSTEVVALQVVVSDRRGASLGDLSIEDFEVREDGKRRPIVAFEAIDASLPPSSRGPSASSLAAVSRRQYLLLFDLSFSVPSGLVRAREAATVFVDGLPSADLVAVGTISVDAGATLLVNLTADRRQVRRAIETLGLGHYQRTPDPLRLAVDLGAEGVLSRDQISGRLGVPAEGGGDSSPGRGQLMEHIRENLVHYRRMQEEEYRRKVNVYLQNLQSFGRAMDWVSGRKEVILLSSGFDPSPLTGADATAQREAADRVTTGQLWEVDSDAYFGSVEARTELFDAMREFASANALIHTVDVSGLAAGGGADEIVGDSRPGAGRETLAQIASASGGQSIQNTNDIAGALCEMAESTRLFYAIAYEPAPGGKPGEFRRIEVKVSRGGTRVSHRRGYRIPDPAVLDNPLARQLRAAEAIAKGLSGGDFEVRGLALPHRDAGGQLSVPLTIELDSSSLFEGDRGVAEVEVYGYAMGPNGDIHDALVFRGMVDRSALSQDADEPLQVKTSFGVPPGVSQLRLVVREAQSGHTGTRSIDLQVPEFLGQEPVLYPPLLMRTLDEANAVDAPSMRQQEVQQPFHVSGRPFGVSLDPELQRSRAQRVCVMFWPGDASYDADAALDLGLDLIGSEGRLPLGVELAQASEEPDGFRRYVLAVTPGEVPDGEYRLEARVVDPATGRETVSSQRVRVVE